MVTGVALIKKLKMFTYDTNEAVVCAQEKVPRLFPGIILRLNTKIYLIDFFL